MTTWRRTIRLKSLRIHGAIIIDSITFSSYLLHTGARVLLLFSLERWTLR
jgi:hypothetical protein